MNNGHRPRSVYLSAQNLKSTTHAIPAPKPQTRVEELFNSNSNPLKPLNEYLAPNPPTRFMRTCLFLQQLKAPADRPPKVPTRILWWLIVPSIFDLAGTNLAQIGLLFTTVSYYQLLRCTVIVVTAFLKVAFFASCYLGR